MKYTLDEHKAKKIVSGRELLESVGITGKIKPETVQQLSESAKGKGNRKLIVQMEAIHVGRTANYTFYTEDGLKEGLDSWTHPYNKPVLTHHNSHAGEPVGRILRAEYTESTISGRKGLIFTCEITDPTAVEKVLDGRYSTVSIGATTDKVTCNICGTDRTKEWCEHWRGEEYEGQTCHYIVGTTFGREVSYVNVPADENAGNFSVSIDDGNDGDTAESALQIFQIAEGLMQNIQLPEVNLYESATDDIRQLVDGLMNFKEGSNENMDEDPENTNQTPVQESVLQTQLNEANERVTKLEKSLSEAQATLSNLVIEKTKVDSQLVESQGEVERLTTENADLIEQAHKALAEKVVDMKLSLRKSDVVGVTPEEAVAEHVKRTTESLNDAVKDLQAEMQNTSAQRGTVQSPGAAGEDNNPNSPQQQEGSKTNMTVAEATNMFKGMFGSKRNR
ncbi:hypothetical protein C2I27_03990 [Priestia megaterium]|uniref:hypothetical protein n=1 Tax=Priestia megaterium TaxID=1404 RepID=UPI000D51BA73|nr:hypothetical protein [Priestia megaterium]PVC75056.1 hypothetical protein C2I27_03990 [Priestia megaterium]